MNDPARHIGIAAASAEGAALCYRTVCIEGASLLGRHDHPEVTLHNHSLAEYMRHIDANRWDEAGRLLVDSNGHPRSEGRVHARGTSGS